MLTRFHKILLGLLAAQVLLIIVVAMRGDDSGALKEHPLVAGFDAAKVTRLQVFAGEVGKPGETGKPIDMVKRDASWVMASSFDYPVDQAKINDVLSPIAKLSAAAPIATQAGRHKQLKVADTEFERKLVITSDGKDLTLYIGASAGARRTAVRIGGSDNVYAVTGISAFTAGSEPRQWVDTGYVKVPTDEIGKVVVHRGATSIELARPAPPPAAGSGSGEGSGSAPPPSPPSAPPPQHWNVAVGEAPVVLATGESIDDTAIDRLVSLAGTIELSAPADPKRDAKAPTATITIERKASGATTAAPTVLDVIADGTSFWVHDRSLSRAAMVDKARIEELVNLDRDKVVKKPPPPPPKNAAPAGAGTGSAARPPGAPVPPPPPAAPRPG